MKSGLRSTLIFSYMGLYLIHVRQTLKMVLKRVLTFLKYYFTDFTKSINLFLDKREIWLEIAKMKPVRNAELNCAVVLWSP